MEFDLNLTEGGFPKALSYEGADKQAYIRGVIKEIFEKDIRKRVKISRIVHIQGGKIASYDNQSGHYKPNAKSMHVADEAFGKLPSTLFKKKGKR